jgi:phosphate/sulfate permease
MKTKLLAVLLPCLSATLQLSAQPIGLPVSPSQIISGTISGTVYDITLTDGTRQTGNYHPQLDEKGNGSIISWPDGGSVTVTRIRDGNAVIFGPSR